MENSTIAIIISIVALAISGVSVYWNISRDIKKEKREKYKMLEVKCTTVKRYGIRSIGREEDDEIIGYQIKIEARNVGQQNVLINNIQMIDKETGLVKNNFTLGAEDKKAIRSEDPPKEIELDILKSSYNELVLPLYSGKAFIRIVDISGEKYDSKKCENQINESRIII